MDVDTGSDDAIALVMAMLDPAFELLGICTVNGNPEVGLATENTLKVIDICGKRDNVKVYRGCDLPLSATLTPWTPQSSGIRSLRTKGEFQTVPGRDEMHSGNLGVHPKHVSDPIPGVKEEPISAVQFYLDALSEAENHSVTLISTGPLTNIAVAIRSDPGICNKIKEIIIMGGGNLVNNISPASEFNIWVDPEAAEIVLQSHCKITMVSLDATYKSYINADEVRMIQALGTAPAALVADLIKQRTTVYAETDDEARDLMIKGAPVRDALAVCAALHPEVLQDVLDCNVHVDIGGGYAYGQTVVDRRIRVVEEEQNCRFALGSDRDFFSQWIYSVLKENRDRSVL